MQAKLTLTFLENEEGEVLIEIEGDLDRPLLYLAAIEVLSQAVQDWFVLPYPAQTNVDNAPVCFPP